MDIKQLRAATARQISAGAVRLRRDGGESGFKSPTFLQRLMIRKDRLRFPMEKPGGAKWAMLNALVCLALAL